MASNLTLSVDRDTIEIAKLIASESNMSVSSLFKKLITEINLTNEKKNPLIEKLNDPNSPEWMRELIIAKQPTPDFDHKAEYHKHLEEKYKL